MTIRKGLNICLLVVFFVIQTACTKQETPKNETPLVTFQVNRQLLGDSVASTLYKITFFPPKDWITLPKDIEEQFRSKLEQANTGDIRPQPLYVFVAKKSKATLMVSSLEFAQLDTNVAMKRLYYVNRIKSQIDSTMLRVAEFRKGTIVCTQCVIRTPTQISFKLLIESEQKLLQFDYIILLSVYNQEIRAVESSIGSIITIQ